MKFDTFFLKIAHTLSEKSKDRSTKVGCVVTAPDRAILTSGWNGFPRGVNDDIEERYERPDKYLWTEHAERNALYNAARHGIPLLGSTMYVTMMPCYNCARGIIQSGIKQVVTYEPDWEDEHRKETSKHDISKKMFEEAGVEIVFIRSGETVDRDNKSSNEGETPR